MIDEVSFLRATFLVMLCVCPVANATDGYFSNGYGTQCKGLAGACTALSLDSMATATNPAGMLGAGQRYELGVDFLLASGLYGHGGPQRSARHIWPRTRKSVERFAAVPSALIWHELHSRNGARVSG